MCTHSLDNSEFEVYIYTVNAVLFTGHDYPYDHWWRNKHPFYSGNIQGILIHTNGCKSSRNKSMYVELVRTQTKIFFHGSLMSFKPAKSIN